jgi:hypothetical protein
MLPQLALSSLQVSGTQQTLFTQGSPLGQAGPQLTLPPQPFGTLPQTSPPGQLVAGLQQALF